MDLKSIVRTIPDYPKKGIMFRDITTLLKHPEGFAQTIEEFKKRYSTMKIDVIAGIEARGFILGAALAYALKKGFVPIRKKGKLPGETISQSYNLEYGSDTIEMHKDALRPGDRVLLMDDLIATGGTALGAISLIEKMGGKLVEAAFIVDLPDLKGREKIEKAGHKVFHLMEFEGD